MSSLGDTLASESPDHLEGYVDALVTWVNNRLLVNFLALNAIYLIANINDY